MKLLIPLLLLPLLLAGCSAAPAPAGTYRRITPDEARMLMSTVPDHVILDVRTPEEYRERHIPHALNVPNETIGASAIPALPNQDQLILVYCRSGNRSRQAAGKLAKLGYTNVVEFGDINSWPGETVTE